MNIAMLSGWHVHAEGYAKELQKRKECKVAAVWDEQPERGEKWAKELGCPYVQDIQDIFSDSTIDAVAVCAPTNLHTDIIIQAANAKKHIFTEKVLALTVSDCERIKKAVEENKVKFCISFPHRCRRELLFAKKLVAQGALGRLTYARIRNVHDGAVADWLPPHFYNRQQCGGGAMIDLGAHPMYLLSWLLGEPKFIQSSFTDITNHGVEDNAVSVIEFENGAIGVSETGIVSVYTPMLLEISGTKGTLMLGNSLSYAAESTKGQWVTPEDLPQALPSPIDQWVDGVVYGKEIAFGVDDAVMLTRLMEGAYISFESGRKVKL